MKGVVSKGERQRVKWRHGPTDNKATEEQGKNEVQQSCRNRDKPEEFWLQRK